jgi:hypothetical protein
MPKISLVVCLYREKDLLGRLMKHVEGCYDDLVVVHDGAETSAFPSTQTQHTSPEQLSLSSPQAPPVAMARDYGDLSRDSTMPPGYRLRRDLGATGTIQELVQQYKGSFYEGPRCFQQEPHWPFAWLVARHNWVLRLDSDEYPSDEMRVWLRAFRRNLAIDNTTSGFTCRWPFWNGRREINYDHLEWRPFLINKRRTAFIGLAEQGPIPLADWKSTGLTLHHRPNRKSFGFAYIFLRKQSYFWRSCIAFSLLKRPTDLPRWNYRQATWPIQWSQIIASPWSTGFRRFIRIIFSNLVLAQKHGLRRPTHQIVALSLHQLSIIWTYGFIKFLHRFTSRSLSLF